MKQKYNHSINLFFSNASDIRLFKILEIYAKKKGFPISAYIKIILKKRFNVK